MRVTICAVGRLRAGPHKDLLDHYTKLLQGAGPQVGVTEVNIIEVDERKGPSGSAAQDWQGQQLLSKVPAGAFVVALDERGKSYSSKDFSLKMNQWAENSRDIAFLIGGADGHNEAVRSAAHTKLALGPPTWPHMLARVLLLEQLYRACCITSGHPYHHG